MSIPDPIRTFSHHLDLLHPAFYLQSDLGPTAESRRGMSNQVDTEKESVKRGQTITKSHKTLRRNSLGKIANRFIMLAEKTNGCIITEDAAQAIGCTVQRLENALAVLKTLGLVEQKENRVRWKGAAIINSELGKKERETKLREIATECLHLSKKASQLDEFLKVLDHQIFRQGQKGMKTGSIASIPAKMLQSVYQSANFRKTFVTFGSVANEVTAQLEKNFEQSKYTLHLQCKESVDANAIFSFDAEK